MSTLSRACHLALILGLISPLCIAQSAETPIFDQYSAGIKEDQNEFIEKALALREKVSAISKADIEKQALNPLPEPVKLAPVLTKQMTTEEITEHAIKSNLRVGYCYNALIARNGTFGR